MQAIIHHLPETSKKTLSDNLSKLLVAKIPAADPRATVTAAAGLAGADLSALLEKEVSDVAVASLLSAVAQQDEARRLAVLPAIDRMLAGKTTPAVRKALLSHLSLLYPAELTATPDIDKLCTTVSGLVAKLAGQSTGWLPKEGKEGLFAEAAHGAAFLLLRSKQVPDAAKTFLANDKLYPKLLPTGADRLAFVQAVHGLLPAQDAGVWSWICATAPYETRSAGLDVLRKHAGDKQWGLLAVRAAAVTLEETQGKNSGATSAEDDDDARWPGAWPKEAQRSSGDAGSRAWHIVKAAAPPGLDALVISKADQIVRVEGNGVWARMAGDAGGSMASEAGAFIDRLLSTECADQAPTEPWRGTLHAASPPKYLSATLSALSVIVALDRDDVTSKLVSWCLDRIRGTDIGTFTAEDLVIWRTPEGQLAYDPVAAKRAKQAEKAAQGQPRTKDEKFDAQLRKELAAKGKTAASAGSDKLTKEEKEVQDAQFKKEAEVRKRAQEAVQGLRSAFGVLRAIIDAAADAEVDLDEEDMDDMGLEIEDKLAPHVSEAVDVLLRGFIVPYLAVPGATETLAGILAKDAIAAYEALGMAAGWRLAAAVHPPRLQAATLRAYGVAPDDSPWKALPLHSLILSALELLEPSVSSPMPSASFVYVFPLLELVLGDGGKVSGINAKVKVDLVQRALDITGSHCRNISITTDPSVPRARIAAVLIDLISRMAAKFGGEARQALVALCQGVGDEKLIRDAGEDESPKDSDSNESSDDVIGELLRGSLSPDAAAREAAMFCMKFLDCVDELSRRVDCVLWCGRFEEAPVSESAMAAWSLKNGEMPIDEDALDLLLKTVVNDVEAIQSSAGRALAAWLELYPGRVKETLQRLYALYRKEAAPPEPEYDEFGILIKASLEKPDRPLPRCGIARALKSSAASISTNDDLQEVFRFLIYDEALGDKSETVRKLMLEACLAIINAHGKENTSVLLPVFDGYLTAPAKASETHDRIREALVVGLGTIAQHLAADDPHVKPILQKLLETLKTPSETVQMAVADCLPPLAKGMAPDEASATVKQMLNQLLQGATYAQRRGAAYGLAGLVKGRGISSLRDFNLMVDLKEAIEDKKAWEKREGALLAYETMSMTLGRLFEPHVIQILPLIVPCFGDGKNEVREATWDTAKAIMGKISQHGVKLILPSLLTGLESSNWRSKVGSIEILGSMAFMAPKQLTASLPIIVPRLTDVLADTHMKVQEAARTALVHFGEVIRNPEIQFLVPILLNALVDPNAKTHSALTALLETAFVHYIDAPSLALVVPILSRGLRERSTDTKKRAAQIMGSMALLTDPKDLLPYMKDLLPLLKQVLVDPVPETRAIAAKALGTIIQKLGEENFADLVGELIDILKSDCGAVDRSGAAQGLSEVLAALDIERFDGLLPEFLANTNSSRVYVREGFLTLFIYLPATFKERYVPYLPDVIPSLLKGLADESESVRDVSLRAGQMVVRNYSSSAIDLLLPELEKGIFDDNWRIRQSSITLLGDLLYRVTGVSGKTATEGEEEMLGTEAGRRALVDTLGMERYQLVLARLYIVRNDVSAVVRTTSLHVWKSIVSNTPRAIKEILPVMMQILIESLGSSSSDKRTVAARTLADLVRKLGENVMQDIMPVVERGLASEDVHTRQGCCIGMVEIMANAGKTAIEEHAAQLVPLIQRALADSDGEVRSQAAKAFDMLQEHMGGKAMDEIVPSLLAQLKKGDASGTALDALRGIMAVKANAVLPQILPTLLHKPITAYNAKALASLLSVSGSALGRRVGVILPALMEALGQKDDAVPDIEEAIKVLLRAVEDDGVHSLVTVLSERISGADQKERAAAAFVVSALFSESQADMSIYINDWISTLVPLLADPDPGMVHSAWRALDALTKSIKKEDLDRYVYQMRKAIASIPVADEEDLEVEGLSLPKGIAPLLPIFLQGLMYASPDIREQSALGVGDLIRRTSPEGLKGFVTQITGPLIRIMGERVMPNVKAAMLSTISLLLAKVPGQLRPFLPQLQRTLTKSLTDPAPVVRDRASKALVVFVGLQNKLDPLVAEIVTSTKANEERGVREATFAALVGLVKTLGPGRELSEASKKSIEKAIEDASLSGVDADIEVRTQAARCFGAYVTRLPLSEATSLLETSVLITPNNWTHAHGISLMILHTLKEDQDFFAEAGLWNELVSTVDALCMDDKAVVAETAIRAAAKMLSADDADQGAVDSLIPRLGSIVATENKPSEVKRAAMLAIKALAKTHHNVIEPFIPRLLGPIFVCVRDRNIPAKLAAERALIHLFDLKRKHDIPNVSSQHILQHCLRSPNLTLAMPSFSGLLFSNGRELGAFSG